MDLLYEFVLLIVRLYKNFQFLYLTAFKKLAVSIITSKLRKIGLRVVFSKRVKKSQNGSSKSDGSDFTSPASTEEKKKDRKDVVTEYRNCGYEMSKPIGDEMATMTIHDDRFFVRLANQRSLGLAESYMDGLWDCNDLVDFCEKMCVNNMPNYLRSNVDKFFHYLEFGLFNLQTKKRAYEVAKGHYDLGNGLFESFLDNSMMYTCAYWRNAKTLEEAQEHKMDLIARKMKLKEGMRVLELGCGWGGLAYYLAKNYNVSVVACNIAKDGCKTAEEKCAGLPVKVLCCDYREIEGKFDRVVAVGLMEHVGPHNYTEFFDVAHRNLEDHGLFLVHTIGMDRNDVLREDPFFCTYIFPNGAGPRATEITKEISTKFTLEDWQNFGYDYSKTLRCWYDNFVRNWPTISHNYENPTQFYRMWTFYLLMSAGGFKSRSLQLWQIVLSKNGFPEGYDSVR